MQGLDVKFPTYLMLSPDESERCFNILAALAFWKRSPGTKWLEGLGNPGVTWTCGRKKSFYPANSDLFVDNGLLTSPDTWCILTLAALILVFKIDEKTI